MTKETKAENKSDVTLSADKQKEANGFKIREKRAQVAGPKRDYSLVIDGEDKTSELADVEEPKLTEIKLILGVGGGRYKNEGKLKNLFEEEGVGLKEYAFKHNGKDLRIILGKGSRVTLNFNSKSRIYYLDEEYENRETIVRDYRLQGLFHPSFAWGERKDFDSMLVVLNSVVELKYVRGVNLVINQDISEGSLTSSYIYNNCQRDYIKLKSPTVHYSEIEEGNLGDHSYIGRSVLRDSSVRGKHISITNSALVGTRIDSEAGLNASQIRLDRSNINCLKGKVNFDGGSFKGYSDLNISTVNDIFIKRKVDVLEYSIGDITLVGARKGTGYPRSIDDENDIEMIISMPYRYVDKNSEIVVNEKDTRSEISAKVAKLIFNRDVDKTIYQGPFQSNTVESTIVESFSDAIMSRLRLLAMIDSALNVGI
jgi:hypothetical protein